MIYTDRMHFSERFDQPFSKEIVDDRIPFSSNSTVRHEDHIASVSSENAPGIANDDRYIKALQFREMIVYFEFLLEIPRLSGLLVSLNDDLVALFGSDGVASRAPSFAED